MKKTNYLIGICVVVVVLGLVFLFIAGRRSQNAEFTRALLSGDTNKVSIILKKSPSLANLKNLQLPGGFSRGREKSIAGWTPLHYAANAGDPEMIDILIHYHADVNARDGRGLTPLLWTSFGGKRDAAAVLLSHGADINARGPDGRTTLDLAKLSLDSKLITLLRERGAKE